MAGGKLNLTRRRGERREVESAAFLAFAHKADRLIRRLPLFVNAPHAHELKGAFTVWDDAPF